MKKKLMLVGAGLHNCALAYELKNYYDIVIYEQRNEIGGNCYSENVEGIEVHKYGPHVFHTNYKKVWDFVNQFSEFNRFQLKPISVVGNDIYSFPINLMTMCQIWGIKTPEEAKQRIKMETDLYKSNIPPDNFEEAALRTIGHTLYNMFFKGYTEKMWGRPCCELPVSIFKRLPVRFSFNNDYFNDIYEGIPLNGYTKMMKIMIKGINIIRKQFKEKDLYGHKIPVVFTGPVDELIDKPFGVLPYRKLEFVERRILIEDYQGVATKYNPNLKYPWTRCTEHKHFVRYKKQLPYTFLTWEVPSESCAAIPAYPIRDANDKSEIYEKYRKYLKAIYPNVILAGRLGTYRYMNMDEVILSALKLADKLKVKA